MICRLETFSFFRHPSRDYVLSHQHTVPELIYYIEGTGTTTVDGESFEYGPGTLAVVLPGTPHDESALTDTQVCFSLFSYEYEHISLETRVFPRGGPVVERIGKVLQTIGDEMQGKRSDYAAYMDLCMGEVLILLGRLSESAGKRTDATDYVKRFLRENCSRDIDFRILAENAGYSYDRFRHLFKEREGIPLSDYLENSRMSRARQMLESGRDAVSVGDVAAACGYRDVSRFIERFRKHTGTTPGRFRDKVVAASDIVLHLESEATT